MSADTCQLRPVVEEGACSLSVCADCGRYQLQVGPVSVRVPRSVLRELHRCLHRALSRDASFDIDMESLDGTRMRRSRH